MGRSLRVVVALVLIGLGTAGCVLVLSGQGLDRAEKWVSIVGMFVSVGLGLAGLLLTWCSRGSTPPAGAVTAARTGAAVARGHGSRANTGVTGPVAGRFAARRTGEAEATDGGAANSGIDG